jgi:hypothetical protein
MLLSLLVNSLLARQKSNTLVLAAVDVEDGTLHPSGFLAAGKGYDLRDIARFPEPRYVELARRALYADTAGFVATHTPATACSFGRAPSRALRWSDRL